VAKCGCRRVARPPTRHNVWQRHEHVVERREFNACLYQCPVLPEFSPPRQRSQLSGAPFIPLVYRRQVRYYSPACEVRRNGASPCRLPVCVVTRMSAGMVI